jgi:hypothetical protein
MDPGSEKGPSLLDLLKLERMWINEEVEELESIGKQRRKIPKGSPAIQKHMHSTMRNPITSSNVQSTRTTRHQSVSGKNPGPVIVNSISHSCIQFILLGK